MDTDITLPAELTIYTAAQTRQAWLGALASPRDGTLRVDAAKVAEVDAAGLQLLLSLRRSMAAQRQSLCLRQPSAALVGACRRAGLCDVLLPEDQA